MVVWLNCCVAVIVDKSTYYFQGLGCCCSGFGIFTPWVVSKLENQNSLLESIRESSSSETTETTFIADTAKDQKLKTCPLPGSLQT
jgi:uncharacterized protein YqkB